jgi:hypothetical protein
VTVLIELSLYENVYLNAEPTEPTPVSRGNMNLLARGATQSSPHPSIPGFKKGAPDGPMVAPGTITLSLLPRLFFTNLYHLEIIRKRSMSKPVSAPAVIPFFLADIGKVKPTSDLSSSATSPRDNRSRILKERRQVHDGPDASLVNCLLACHVVVSKGGRLPAQAVVDYLLRQSSAAIDLEVQLIVERTEFDFGPELLVTFLFCLLHQIARLQNFEMMQALLYRTLITHDTLLLSIPQIRPLITALSAEYERIDSKLRDLADSNICLLRLAMNMNTD